MNGFTFKQMIDWQVVTVLQTVVELLHKPKKKNQFNMRTYEFHCHR